MIILKLVLERNRRRWYGLNSSGSGWYQWKDLVNMAMNIQVS
jgi:hypothetical protein